MRLIDVVDDRYAGLLVDQADALAQSDIQEDLDSVLTRLAEGLIRRRTEDAEPVLDELEASIRERLVSWATRQLEAEPAA